MAFVGTVVGRMQVRGAANIKAQADLVMANLGYTAEAIEKINAQQQELNRYLITGMNVLNVVQLTRMEIMDVQKLATGQGSLSTVLSLGLSTILLLYRINALLREKIALQVTSQALSMIANAAAPIGGTNTLITAGVVGVAAGALWAVSSYRQGAVDGIAADQRNRMMVYRSIVGN